MTAFQDNLAQGENVLVCLHNARTRKHKGEVKLSAGNQTVVTEHAIDRAPLAMRQVTKPIAPNVSQITSGLSHTPVHRSCSWATAATALATSLTASASHAPLRAQRCAC